MRQGGSLINFAQGPGTKTLDKLDMVVLMFSYFDEPTQCNGSYVEHLFAYTGTVVSESVVSRFFNHGFPISGMFRMPNLVPIDKFKPDNILRAQEYLMVLSTIDPMQVWFGDKKLVTGSELFCCCTRRNVLTGEVPCVVTTSDFRNTYSIYGMCGINPTTTTLYLRIRNGTNDSEEFA